APAAAPAGAPGAPPAAAAGADDKYVYFLQAGAFREISDAEATRAKLALLGFEAAISDRTSDSGVLHRVRLGPFSQVEAVNKARAKLLDSGIDVAIVRNQK
ncbi:MAG: cell division protein, partial [Massilia sp.]|nr:cell division protein [Massilia sp.]